MLVSHFQSGSESLQVHLYDSLALAAEHVAYTFLDLLHLDAEEWRCSTEQHDVCSAW